MSGDSHDHKGYSEEKCVRCGWVMGHPPLNCQNDNTPHQFPSQARTGRGKQRMGIKELADAVRLLHSKRSEPILGYPADHGYCVECRQTWPCMTEQAIAEVLQEPSEGSSSTSWTPEANQ